MKRIFAHIGFSAAVTLLAVNLIEYKYIPLIAAGLAVIWIASLAVTKYRQALTVPICLGSALFACLVFCFIFNTNVMTQQQLDSKTADTSFYIVSLEEKVDSGYVYTAKTQSVDISNAPQNIKIRIKSKKKINVSAYTVIHAKADFKSVSSKAFASNGYWGNNVFLYATIDDYTVTQKQINSFWRYALNLRSDIINTLISLIDGDRGVLAAALLTGEKSKLSIDAYTNFCISGASHLMAVSGMHLTVLTAFILFIFKKLRMNDRCSAFICIFIILFYCGVAGFSKSVIRAAIMMIVMLLGRLFNKRADALNSLGLAVSIICLNPFAVCDIGAVLSVLAVLSLVTLYPYFAKKLHISVDDDGGFVIQYSNSILSHILSGFFVTLSIMIYTMPAMYVFYGYISIVSLIANIVIVPLGSITMILSLLAYIMTKIGVFNIPFIFLTKLFTGAILKIVEFFASFRNASIPFCDYFGLMIAAILILFAFCFFFNNNRFFKGVAVISAIAVTASFVLSSNYYNKTSKMLLCENSAVVICSEDKTVVFNLNSSNDYYSVYSFLFSNGKDIDYLISDSTSDYYSEKLVQRINCKNYITNDFNENVLINSHCSNLIVCSDYSSKLCDDYSLKCSFNDSQLFVRVNTADIQFEYAQNDKSEAQFLLCNQYVKDKNGVIDLSQGDVVYSITDYNTFSVRRDNWWLK